MHNTYKGHGEDEMTKYKNQNIKLEKVDDKTAYENLIVKYSELENKVADIKANCDLAIEGRDVKIKELEQELTVEKDQHQEEINLHLHAEDYIKELEQQIEKMKCCYNCLKWNDGECEESPKSKIFFCADFKCDKWECIE